MNSLGSVPGKSLVLPSTRVNFQLRRGAGSPYASHNRTTSSPVTLRTLSGPVSIRGAEIKKLL